MEFFEELDSSVQNKAYEFLAYELLDEYLENADSDVAEGRLMESLKFHPNFICWYEKYEKEIGAK
jgi:hypothetical protein